MSDQVSQDNIEVTSAVYRELFDCWPLMLGVNSLKPYGSSGYLHKLVTSARPLISTTTTMLFPKWSTSPHPAETGEEQMF